jgi:hypothetical protein
MHRCTAITVKSSLLAFHNEFHAANIELYLLWKYNLHYALSFYQRANGLK